MRRLTLGCALFAAISAGVATAAYAVPKTVVSVDHCGTVVPDGAIAVVQRDLSCTADPAVNEYFGIVLGRNSELDLNFHTITLVQDQSTIAIVLCRRACVVYGPGTITNIAPSGGAAIWSPTRSRVEVRDVTISRMTTGIESAAGFVVASRVSINASRAGIWLAKRVALDHVAVTLPGVGSVFACIGATQPSGRVDGNDVTATGCQTGVYGTHHVKLTRLTVTNSLIGVFSAGTMQLTDSSVTASTQTDLLSRGRPVLVDTTCGSSTKLRTTGTPATWGVCTND